ncbi:MAG: P44/Msp2 family outer membrane protein [Rickettsiaceae bacterium H1]|nr:P44/Msp2 family outer membrane protein [Rickettsiaceae bacterium H1]
MLSKKLLIGVAALSCLVAINPSHSMNMANTGGSMYASLGGNAQFVIEPEFKVATAGYNIQGTTDGTNYTDGYKPKYKLGYIGSLSVGMPFSALRVELEGQYASVKVADEGDNQHAGKFRVVDSSNKTSKYVDFTNDGFSHWGGMANVYYDMVGALTQDNFIIPYVGGGAGISHITFNGVSRNTLMYQAKGGVTVRMFDEARLFLGYKYLAVMDGDKGFEGVTDGTATGSPTVTKFDIKAPYSIHGPEVGVLVNFSY